MTPVADARTLVEIVWLLPGKAARAFRRTSAVTVCRVLGGDLTMVQEIEARHNALASTVEGQHVQEFLVPDAAPSPKRFKGELPMELQLASAEQKSSYFDMWLQQQKQQLEETKRTRDVAFVQQGYEVLSVLGVADERDKITFGDAVRRLIEQPPMSASPSLILASSPRADDFSVATPHCGSSIRGPEISMHSASSKFNIRIGRGKEVSVGKAMKRLYKERYGAEAASAIPKRNVPFRGSVFAENAYWQRDEDLMKLALEEVHS